MQQKSKGIIPIIILVILFIAAATLGFFALTGGSKTSELPSDTISPEDGNLSADASSTEPTPPPTPTPVPTPTFDTPAAISGTTADDFGYRRELELNGEPVDSYVRTEAIDFGEASEYSALPGISTFRGTNHREGASYGTISNATSIDIEWTASSGSMTKGISSGGEGSWTGSGWVGQPLIVEWPSETKAIMNMYDWAKEKDGLVEIIYATMDGNVYFLDLESGEATRDKLRIGMPFKGAGSLDPRGYPILYLGSGEGYDNDEQDTRAMAYSLIDFTRLYEFGHREDDFSLRGWHAYDSAPLIDGETDTLFYAGENGILYSIHLNTQYDEAAGTLTMNPDEVLKYRYGADRTQNRTGENAYWLGFEASPTGWQNYIYMPDNAGLMHCIDVNTMDIVWVQDTWDDSNGTAVLQEDEANRTAYLYAGTSLHWKADSDGRGDIGFFKIDAVTGETIWTYTENVATVSGVSGGIQATAVLGREGSNIEHLVFIPIARTPSTSTGELVAIDQITGEAVWTYELERYAWSSPVAVYKDDGTAYIVQFDTTGNVYLLDALTGTLVDTMYIESNNFEASPAVYGDTIVVGSRAQRIYGIKIS